METRIDEVKAEILIVNGEINNLERRLVVEHSKLSELIDILYRLYDAKIDMDHCRRQEMVADIIESPLFKYF